MWERKDADDSTLLNAAREGDREAYAELYRRHRGAAARFGVRLTGDLSSAHDLVSEAFVKLMRQLDRGSGPDGHALAYLMAIMRNLHVDQFRRHGREVPTEDVLEALPPPPACDESDRLVEGALVAKAFASLSESYRAVLWQTEVLGRPLSEVADALGTTRNAVGVQAFRAREALREAYLTEHVGTVTNQTCRDHVRLLPKYVRGNLPERRRSRLERHLSSCACCAAAHQTLRRMNTHLSAAILPAVALGVTRFSGVGAASSPSGAGAPVTLGGGAGVGVGVAVALAVVAVGVLAVSRVDHGHAPSRRADERGTTAAPPSPSASAPAPERSRPPRAPSATLAPNGTPTIPAPPASPSAPPTPPSRSPTPTPTTPIAPSPTPQKSLSAPYITVTRSDNSAAVRLLSRVTGVAEGTTVTLTATNATAPETAQLDGWRCTQVQPRPSTLRLTCRATRTATPLYSVGLTYVDPEAALTGTIGLDGGLQTLSFVATA